MATLGIFSARADGATTVAVGLAACLSARARTLLVDLNFDCPEVAPLLDTGCSKTIYHLAYNPHPPTAHPDERAGPPAGAHQRAAAPGVGGERPWTRAPG